MARLLVVLLCTFAVLAAGQGSTVKPADTDAEIPASDALATPTPEVKYEHAPIPTATPDSTTFRKVPNVECSDPVAKQVALIYSKNRDIFDVCAERSKYQIFPFSGKLPTQQQIYALATTKACTALFTACVLANMPQCDVSALGLKAVTESLLKITVDIDNGLPTPDTQLFHEIHTWRRDVNLAQAAGVPFGNDSQLYKEFTRNLWTALTKYNVRVMPDLSIVYNATDLTSSINGSTLSNLPSTSLFNTSSGVALDLAKSQQNTQSASTGSQASGNQDVKSSPSTSSTTSTSAAISLRLTSTWLAAMVLAVFSSVFLLDELK